MTASGLVACTYPTGVCVHRAECEGVTGRPRWQVSEAEVREHPDWLPCELCRPLDPADELPPGGVSVIADTTGHTLLVVDAPGGGRTLAISGRGCQAVTLDAEGVAQLAAALTH